MANARSALLLGAGLLGAGAWIATAGRRTVPTDQLELVASELDLAIRETSASAHSRAVTLAELPRLGWAVATDETTVRDLTMEELAFRPRPGEQIEIFQVERPSGKVQRLIAIPSGTRPMPLLTEPGLYLDVNGDQVRVTALVTVQPRQRVETVGGLLAVAEELNLTAVGARLDAANIAGRLETASGSTMLGTAQPPRGARAVEVPLQSPAARGARLFLSVPTGILWGQVAGALALLAAAVISARAVGRPKRARDPAEPTKRPEGKVLPLQPPEAAEFPDEITAVRGAMEAVGGAAPMRLRPLEVSGPIITRETALTTIPSTQFIIGAGPPPVPHRDDNPHVAEYRALFGEFVKLRRTCGESTEDLSRDRFVAALLHKGAELRASGTSEVRFRLVFDNGKAAVRYKKG